MEVFSIFTSPNHLLLFYYSTFLWSITNRVSVSATISYDNLTFSLVDFEPNDHAMLYEGDAYPSNNVIQLTINQTDMPHNGSVGRTVYKDPFHLWEKVHDNLADFTTNFSFSIDSQGGSPYGDGFAFFLAPNGSSLPDNSGDGNFGLLNPNQMTANFVAIEFDTYKNEWDPSEKHIGIDVNSVRSLNPTTWWWGDIENGGKAHAIISYNSSSQNLTLFLVDERDTEVSQTNSSTFIFNIDLRNHLPEWVTIGFSGSTGASFENHTISSWNFSSRLQIEVKDPTTTNPASSSINSKKGINKKWFGIILAMALSLLIILGFGWFGICSVLKSSRRTKAQWPFGA